MILMRDAHDYSAATFTIANLPLIFIIYFFYSHAKCLLMSRRDARLADLIYSAMFIDEAEITITFLCFHIHISFELRLI